MFQENGNIIVTSSMKYRGNSVTTSDHPRLKTCRLEFENVGCRLVNGIQLGYVFIYLSITGAAIVV